LKYTDPSGWQQAAYFEYRNLGKQHNDFISFSGQHASEMYGNGEGGAGYDGGDGWWGNYQDACKQGYMGGIDGYFDLYNEAQKDPDFNGVIKYEQVIKIIILQLLMMVEKHGITTSFFILLNIKALFMELEEISLKK
jgi:hypothetical protein